MTTPDDPSPDLHAVLTQAHALIDRQRFAQARQRLSGALQAHPEHADLLYLLAFIDYSERSQDDPKKIADADRTVTSVLAQAPQHYGARTLRAVIYEEQRRYAQAEATWIELLRDYPESADCYAGYADLMLRTLHLDKAQRLTQEGLRLRPEHSRCLFIACLVQVIQGRSLTKEGEHLQQLLREHPEKVNTLITLVIALEQRGDGRAALRVAQQLLRMHPEKSNFVELVRTLKRNTHWSMLPLYPMLRWGWGGAAAVTVIGMVGVRVAGHTLPTSVALLIVYGWLAYVIYSWVWPGILKKMI
jgi:cytochrome c-type biogenesis protein CcmH/NrfG